MAGHFPASILCIDYWRLKLRVCGVKLPVMGMAIQVAELPNGGIGPPTAVILFGFTFQFEEMGTQVVTIGQIPHDVKEPIAHPPWEISHLIRRALLREKFQSIINYLL